MEITPYTYTIHLSKKIPGNTFGSYANELLVELGMFKHPFSLLLFEPVRRSSNRKLIVLQLKKSYLN